MINNDLSLCCLLLLLKLQLLFFNSQFLAIRVMDIFGLFVKLAVILRCLKSSQR